MSVCVCLPVILVLIHETLIMKAILYYHLLIVVFTRFHNYHAGHRKCVFVAIGAIYEEYIFSLLLGDI